MPGEREAQPCRIRMFCDDFSRIVLWDDDDTDHLEDELPIPEALRVRVKNWLRDWEENMRIELTLGDAVKHDRRGYQLSLDLQEALGPGYEIEYLFDTQQLRRELRGGR